MIYQNDFWKLLDENFWNKKVGTQIIFSTTTSPFEMGFFMKKDVGSELVVEVQLADFQKDK